MGDKNIDKKLLKVLLNKKYNQIIERHQKNYHTRILLCSFEEYNKKHLNKKETKDILLKEFINAISSVGGGTKRIGLYAKGKKEFKSKVVSKLHIKKGKAELEEFFQILKTFDKHKYSKQKVSERMQKIVDILDQIPGAGYKTASMFLRDIIYNLHLFHGVKKEDWRHMRIPVDINVMGMYNAIYGTNFKSKKDKDKKEIDRRAEEIFEKHPKDKIKFDNLWFFGKFYFCKGIKSKLPKKKKGYKPKKWCELNEEKMEVDLTFDYKLREKFIKIMPKICPFYKFCKLYKK